MIMRTKLLLLITGVLLGLNSEHYSKKDVASFVEDYMNTKYENEIKNDNLTPFKSEHMVKIEDETTNSVGWLIESEDVRIIFLEDSDEILGSTGYKIYDNMQANKIHSDLKKELSLYGIEGEYLDGYNTYDGSEEYKHEEHWKEILNSCYNEYYTGNNLEEVINEMYRDDKYRKMYDIGKVNKDRANDIPDIIMNLKYKINLAYDIE